MDHDLTEEPYEEDKNDDDPLAGVDGVSLASDIFIVFQCHRWSVALLHTAALAVCSCGVHIGFGLKMLVAPHFYLPTAGRLLL